MLRRVLLMVSVGVGLLICGCTTEEADEARAYAAAVAAGEEPDSGTFHVDVTLHRRYTGDWRRDRDHVFTIKDESHVKAEVELVNVTPGRTYTVHLAWIRPDGWEIFRRCALVTHHEVALPDGVAPDSTGALPARYVDELKERWGDDDGEELADRLADDPEDVVTVNERTYVKAVDLGDRSRFVYVDRKPVLNAFSRLNISREKERDLGTYHLRVYLDRRLAAEVPFTVQENS
jgi:hypothetical protein